MSKEFVIERSKRGIPCMWISIPVVRGGVQRQAFILPDLSGFQSLISRIANKPKTNTTQ